MKNEIIKSLGGSLAAQRDRHLLNAKIMIENPMAIHDHTDLLTAIESELAQAAEYNDKLEMLNLLTIGS